MNGAREGGIEFELEKGSLDFLKNRALSPPKISAPYEHQNIDLGEVTNFAFVNWSNFWTKIVFANLIPQLPVLALADFAIAHSTAIDKTIITIKFD